MAKNKADRLKGASFTKKMSQKEGTNVDEESSEEESMVILADKDLGQNDYTNLLV
jgi:hypothetical protein